MAIERHFLGWDRPGLGGAAEWLLERGLGGAAGVVDLRRTVVALPGARAARRLLDRLVERAESRALRLVPPRLVTIGAAVELLVVRPRPAAGAVLRRLTWARALRDGPAPAIERLLHLPDDGSAELRASALAERLDALHAELAGAGIDFAQVPARAVATLPDFVDEDRWRALGAVQALYRRALAALGYEDPHDRRWRALAERELRPGLELVLVGVLQLNGLQRALLRGLDGAITVLVHAPESRAGAFDAFGTVRREGPAALPHAVPDSAVRVADRPPDQAEAVVAALAELGGRYAVDQVSVGACDDDVTPYVEQRLASAGVPVHDAAGRPLARVAPVGLLRAVAEWLEGRRHAAAAALVRHPDFEAAVDDGATETVRSAAEVLDRVHRAHLPAQLDGDLPRSEESRAARALTARIDRLLGELTGPPRPLARWAAPAAELLVRVFGRAPLDVREPGSRARLDVLDALHAVLVELAELPAAAAPEPVSAGAALRLIVRHAELRGRVPSEPDTDAVELLGPLELALDDAPVLVLAGVNEGRFPSAVNADAFLPDRLRRALGLVDNVARLARDAAILAAVLATRAEVRIVVGRRTLHDDPLWPSRLLLAGDGRRVAERVRRLVCRDGAEPAALPSCGELRPGERSAFRVPDPEPVPAAPSALGVTQFRDYLACPYRFWLRHVLRLEEVDDGAEELDAAAFGQLAHETLAALGEPGLAAAADADRVARALRARLDAIVRERYGSRPQPAVRVQVEHLAVRFRAFADWQAERARAGWRVVRVEVSPAAPVPFPVDGVPFGLVGRIDRIDRHDRDGRWALLDYKTGERPADPERSHRRAGRWIDLQLPLYRHLARAVGVEGPIELGFVRLPNDPARVDAATATWDEATLADADEQAREVVRALRAGLYPRAPVPPPFDAFADVCQVQRLGDDDLDEPLDEDDEEEAR